MTTMLAQPVLSIPSFAPSNNSLVPCCYEPGPYDVICGRGKETYFHSGNQFFRKLVEKRVAAYSATASKAQRSGIVSDIIDNFRFIKKESDGAWVEVSDVIAREKTGQVLRGLLGTRYKSSNESKKKRRQRTAAHFHAALSKIMQSNAVIKSKTEEMKTEAKQSSHLSDEAIMMMFSAQNQLLLQEIKTDSKLVNKFTSTYRSRDDEEP